MQIVHITTDPLSLDKWYTAETEDIRQYLMNYFEGYFPETAKIYHEEISESAEVTPKCEEDVDRLATLNGNLFVIVYPAGPIAITLGVVIAVIAVAAVAFLIQPTIPNSQSQNNNSSPSPNNKLSDRDNQPRINQRIPDIYGGVRSTPDLISLPYRVYENNREVEIAYMCIGRGDYEVSKIRDGESLINNIGGASVSVYPPNTSPNNGTPSIQIGDAIDDSVIAVIRVNEVNGQTLIAPNKSTVNAGAVRGVGDQQGSQFGNPQSGNKWRFRNNVSFDWSEYFSIGDLISISGSSYVVGGVNGGNAFDLDGDYSVLEVYNEDLVVEDANIVNPNWDFVNQAPIDETGYSPLVARLEEQVILGPFFLDFVDSEEVFINLVAVNGLYKDNGTNQFSVDVTIRIEVTPADQNGNNNGTPETFNHTLTGSSSTTDQRALTIKVVPSFMGRSNVRVWRVSDTDRDFTGSVVDEVKIRDLYSVKNITQDNFGDITTIHSRTIATSEALAIKSRKLNCEVIRKVPIRTTGVEFSNNLVATKRVSDIISAVCLDKYIGNRNINELDLEGIYNTVDTIETYFNSSEPVEFCHTFDSDNLSFEETISLIAENVFCTAYRQGNQIKLKSETLDSQNILLFNHRNKIPNSETRTITFGNQDNHDGVELDYASPDDGVTETYFIPSDKSSVNPKKVETIGTRNFKQAYLHAWRIWNKIQYQNKTIEFETTQESAILVLKDRVLVSDNTRPDTQDGEVVLKEGLLLTLSQNINFDEQSTYTIFLQNPDGSIESVPITETAQRDQVTLNFEPTFGLSLDLDNYARTTFIIVKDQPNLSEQFMIVEKDAKSHFDYSISAINYSDLYYQQDILELWLPFSENSYDDKSSNSYRPNLFSIGALDDDPIRGLVHNGTGGNSYATFNGLASLDSYTKMAWVNKTSFSNNSHILSSRSGTSEMFFISTLGKLSAGHNNFTSVESDIVDLGVWVHCCVTYSSSDLTMCLYVNGSLVDVADNVPNHSNSLLSAFGFNGSNSFIGKCDNLKLFTSKLSDKQIIEIYQNDIL
jgi:hypothetical protein